MFKDQFYRRRKCPKHIDDNIYAYSPCNVLPVSFNSSTLIIHNSS